ncbi:putative tricarboxylic transport membrane protein [Noviherbaspirillum humi]|uniref:Putative tricarboxylic transport membrane protein n=1 Tax=Noviherbaspirillum humi TaxID=1688639 RepID=A0A239C2P4_9BURK|nr:tripartite tricarboxylate transporter substrate-binding protein [Noviherbaspirillum humi]SNS13938.1 putative tricarboxylic transport membrane protein [Noviherbaspirillum humi]
MRSALKHLIAAAAVWTSAAAMASPQCLVPAKPGGGMDLTCKLTQKGLADLLHASAAESQMQLSYMPGGVGAVAWNAIVSQRRAEAQTLVVFSGGSLLNLALGKFGKSSPADVRWVAALGADYGMIAVRSDSPYKTLKDLMDAIRRDPAKVSIGGSGTVGSQDWLKMALIAKRSGIEPKALRFVALEGGGEAFTALSAGYVQAVSGDASEALSYAGKGNVRVLAVLADERLPGALAAVPTAREQGFDLSWPIIRGFYMGPQVSDADYRRWVQAFDRMLAQPAFDRMRADYGLYPFALTGDALTAYIRKTVDGYGRQAKELGLVR